MIPVLKMGELYQSRLCLRLNITFPIVILVEHSSSNCRQTNHMPSSYIWLSFCKLNISKINIYVALKSKPWAFVWAKNEYIYCLSFHFDHLGLKFLTQHHPAAAGAPSCSLKSLNKTFVFCLFSVLIFKDSQNTGLQRIIPNSKKD